MKLEHPLAFADLPGYSPHLSRLLAMMTYARDTTLHVARGLSAAQLDILLDELIVQRRHRFESFSRRFNKELDC